MENMILLEASVKNYSNLEQPETGNGDEEISPFSNQLQRNLKKFCLGDNQNIGIPPKKSWIIHSAG